MLAFSAHTRLRSLEEMAQRELDILVVGGGVTGSGIALDAASRGLSVGLVEKEDFAAGTSGHSSRLIHGGARYLQQGEFGLVREALRERAILLRLAPHLVRPVPMFAPLRHLTTRMQWRLGLVIYDTLALWRNLGRHRATTEQEVRAAIPGLGRPSKGVRYWECRTDDARLTLEVARTAAAQGALVANHAEVSALLGEGRVRGATVVDRITGESLDIKARITVNASGVWADAVQGMATDSPRALRPSKGVHLVFRPGAVDTRVALLVPSGAGDGRFIFILPWGGRTYAGTTDTAYEGSREHPEVTAEDRDYLLAAVHRAFPTVSARDIVASWAGLRPLLGGKTGATADLSRKHAIYESPPGLLTITGGKLTTFRDMAEDLVDRAGRMLGVRRGSRTRTIPLGIRTSLDAALASAAAEAETLGLLPEAGHRLVYRYGDDWVEALRLIRDGPGLGDPAVPGLPVLGVELELARSREMALTDDDVLVRRTRITTLDESATLPTRG